MCFQLNYDNIAVNNILTINWIGQNNQLILHKINYIYVVVDYKFKLKWTEWNILTIPKGKKWFNCIELNGNLLDYSIIMLS